MRYLITHPDHKPFYSGFFTTKEWVNGSVVFDLTEDKFTTNGFDWEDIEID